MFTGIIEEVGTVRHMLPGARAGSIAIAAHVVVAGTRIGDSIAVNGVCLTVTACDASGFTADVMPETLKRSNLGSLSVGDAVNLERALAADGRFGGHIVSGHIDGTGRIESVQPDENAVRIRIRTTPAICALIVEKGSIAIDGVSLTVTDVDASSFGVSVIPHTGEATTLIGKRVGAVVNLENDVVGKYVAKLLGAQGFEARAADAPATASESRHHCEGGITMAFLAENGF